MSCRQSISVHYGALCMSSVTRRTILHTKTFNNKLACDSVSRNDMHMDMMRRPCLWLLSPIESTYRKAMKPICTKQQRLCCVAYPGDKIGLGKLETEGTKSVTMSRLHAKSSTFKPNRRGQNNKILGYNLKKNGTPVVRMRQRTTTWHRDLET
ncbi:hypothetical protein ElyMa_001117000 [Elysia marginata]|uniref:Uncharacterized protein n=1 Tax=Elysia marginata TaxID=1093978 RepID=A0AAV4HW61_9GAST|nr:hypothetical protein ElyMa_001117000 [Elysia marginata]